MANNNAKDGANKRRHDRTTFRNGLMDILDRYPKLQPESIRFAAPVYYPIAQIDITADEDTFENFDLIYKSVLQIAQDVGQNPEEIADVLGLSENYVTQVLTVLRGYGHIDADGLTENGRKSLETGQKVMTKTIKQRLQVDALNLVPIRLEDKVSERNLISPRETDYSIGLLFHEEGIALDSLESQIRADLDTFIRRGRNIINVNLHSLNDVKCQELDYTLGILVCFETHEGQSAPIVFARRRINSWQKRNQQNQQLRTQVAWVPFAVRSETMRRQYGLPETAPLQSQNHILDEFYERLCRKRVDYYTYQKCSQGGGRKKRTPAEIETKMFETMQHVIGDSINLNNCRLECEYAGTGILARVKAEVRSWAIVKYSDRTFYILLHMAEHGAEIIADDILYGTVLLLQSTDKDVLDMANRLKSAVATYGTKDLRAYLSEYMNGGDQKDDTFSKLSIVERLAKLLNSESLQHLEEHSAS